MAKLIGVVVDAETGQRVESRVQVLASSGIFAHPTDAILKVGPGAPFFYSDGSFEVELGKGPVQLTVERGTEYEPATIPVQMPSRGVKTVEIALRRWAVLGESGWHPGNTHIHYDEKETRPDERLALDPRVEDLRMTAVSILKRRELGYATNRYTPGFLTEFSSAHHYVQSGEESRHNSEPWSPGYGHMMLLNIRNVVDPLSRGVLVDSYDPDYPPLSYACDDAHRQGGIVIWCHNGQAMEAPVAAALGKLDAFNLFDPNWTDLEYDIYYRMLNAGFRLPASTGSDWFISSANRVYAGTGKAFDYADWLDALKGGRTFITNGPAVFLSVNGEAPGSAVDASGDGRLTVDVRWDSHYPVHTVEVIANGQAIGSRVFTAGSKSGEFTIETQADSDGWVAARLSSDARDSFAQPVFAHTSPVYVATGKAGPHKRAAGAAFDQAIDRSLEWVNVKGRFYSDAQRQEVVDLFKEGQQVYKDMSR